MVRQCIMIRTGGSQEMLRNEQTELRDAVEDWDLWRKLTMTISMALRAVSARWQLTRWRNRKLSKQLKLIASGVKLIIIWQIGAKFLIFVKIGGNMQYASLAFADRSTWL